MIFSSWRLPKVVTRTWTIARTAVDGFLSHNAPRLSASLSFYSVFSLAPLLVLVLAITSLVLDAGRSRDFLMEQLIDTWGQTVADTVGQMIDRVNRPGDGLKSAIIAFGGMALGATAVFAELKRSLDDVFGAREVASTKPAWYSLLAVRMRTISLILALALLLLASLLLSASLTTFVAVASTYLPPWIKFVWIADQVISIAGAVALYFFGMRFFPDRPPSKAAALRGALVSALLFAVGRHLIGLYIGVAGTASAFGAAGTLAVILIWMHYTWQILIFGAEVARAVDLHPREPVASPSAPAPAAGPASMPDDHSPAQVSGPTQGQTS